MSRCMPRPLLLAAFSCCWLAAEGRNIIKTFAEMFFGQVQDADVHLQELAVIGAGASRTGTQSITEALHILGFPVYNLISIVNHRHLEDATAALRDPAGAAGPFFDKVLASGHPATLDTPTNLLWREQVARFPNAKVLLSVRDTPEVWRKSFAWAGDAFAPMSASRPWKWIVDLTPLLEEISLRVVQLGGGEASGCVPRRDFVKPWWAPWVEYLDSQSNDPDCLRRYYENANQQVRAAVPAENLLEFNVKEGWGPLCAFLNVTVPSQPFPHVNSTRELVLAHVLLRAVCWLYPIFVMFPAWLCYSCFFRRRHPKGKSE